MKRQLGYILSLSCALLISFAAVAAPADSATPNTSVIPASNTATPDTNATSSNTATTSDATASSNNDNNEYDIPAIEQPVINDPLEGYNRLVFEINDKLDKYLLKPIAKFYNTATPKPLVTAANNFFSNLKDLNNIANDVLQVNFYQATSDAWRFAINSSAGMGGIFDFASDLGLPPNPEDFGLTMAKWGWKNSIYFIVPILGPRTFRDALAIPVDYYMSFYPYTGDSTIENSLYVAEKIGQRAQLLRFDKVYAEVAIDPYVFLRNAYFQRRDYLIGRTQELDSPYTARDMQESDGEDTYYLNE